MHVQRVRVIVSLSENRDMGLVRGSFKFPRRVGRATHVHFVERLSIEPVLDTVTLALAPLKMGRMYSVSIRNEVSSRIVVRTQVPCRHKDRLILPHRFFPLFQPVRY